jgi:4-amino-4-deoxy-L-arabinose transferase-like glycosyltransferase
MRNPFHGAGAPGIGRLMTEDPLPATRSSGQYWAYAALLSAFVLLTFFPRIGDLPTRGEETRWATAAREMAATGDWIMPRQQGEPFLSRPPLGSWLIAAAAEIRGELDLAAVRLPTASAVLVLSLLIMWYSAKSLPVPWAFASGLSFASCLQVLQLGRVAETDMVFAALVGGSMLGWRGTWRGGEPATLSWILGYGLASVACLAKSPQAPAYFVGAAALCLFMEGKLLAAMTRRHLAGVVAFLVVFFAWHWPASQIVGFSGVKAFWTGDVKLRWVAPTFQGWATHLIAYPIELIGCFLPWTIALAPLASREVRKGVLSDPYARFAIAALAVAFPTCWLTPNARVRYFLPLFPQIAVLTGATLWITVRTVRPWLSTWLSRVETTVFGALVACSVVVFVGSAIGYERGLYVSPTMVSSGVFLSGCMLAGLLVWLMRRASAPRRVLLATTAAAVMFSVADNFVRLPMLIAKGVDTERMVAELRERYDSEGAIPSIGPVHHRFAYFYRDPIPLIPTSKADMLPEGSLFTLTPDGPFLFQPPFPYEVLDKLPCDRNFKAEGTQDYVILARRLPAAASRTMPPKR